MCHTSCLILRSGDYGYWQLWLAGRRRNPWNWKTGLPRSHDRCQHYSGSHARLWRRRVCSLAHGSISWTDRQKLLYMANHNLNIGVIIRDVNLLVPHTHHTNQANNISWRGGVSAVVEYCIVEWERPPIVVFVDFGKRNSVDQSVVKIVAQANGISWRRPQLSLAAGSSVGWTIWGRYSSSYGYGEETIYGLRVALPSMARSGIAEQRRTSQPASDNWTFEYPRTGGQSVVVTSPSSSPFTVITSP